MATFTKGAGRYTLILNVNEVDSSSNITNNTSDVSWSLQMRADSAYCQWNPGPGDFEVRIDGALVWSAQNPSLWYSGYPQTLTIASGTRTVGHNSDGSKTVYCEGKYIANSTANYLPSSSTCGGNLGLSTIPRASSFGTITGNTIGGSQTINIDRKSSAFTHSLWYRIGSGSWVSIGTGIATSKTWTLPKSLNNEIPNATSLTLTYLLRTYNGGSQIGGDVTYSFKVNYSGEKPTAGSVSITYASLFNNKFIANYSTATIKYSGYGGVYGSTVKSAQIIFNGSWKGTASYSTGKLTAGTHTYQGVVTDSRNSSSYAAQKSFTCYQINNPSVSINAYRSDSAGNANPSGTYITIIPTYSAHNPVGGNSIKSNSFTCTSLMTTGTAISSGAKKILSGAAVDSEYIISGTVTDQLGRSSATSIKIGTAFAIWDVRPDEKGMAFGRYSTGANKFEVAWNAYFDGLVSGSEVKGTEVTANRASFYSAIVSGDNGKREWVKLGSISNTTDSHNTVINLYSGNGYNGESRQNGWAKIIIKDGYQSTPSTTKAYGVTVELQGMTMDNFKAKILATASNACDVWVYMPWGYWQGHYTVEHIDTTKWTHSGNHQESEPSGVEQQIKYLYSFFPVGAVYISVTAINPSVYFGGTWVTFGQGRTLVGVNTSDSDFNTVEKTGGNKAQTLVAKIGAYDSRTDKIGYTATGKAGNAGFTYGGSFNAAVAESSISTSRINHHTQVDQGNGNPPTTIQPYVTVYFWKRTA